MARMMIVDGMSVLKTTSGSMAFLTNGFSYNFFQQLTATLRKFPDVKGVIVCWEGGYEHRTKIYPDYKNGRTGSSEEVKEQRKIVQELLKLLGIDQVYAPGHEGDDMGAWLTHNLGVQCVLYSNDRDWLQLVRPGISIYQKSAFTGSKKKERVEITAENFTDLTGWPSPALYLRAKCIMGDGDEIPGLVGVGEKTTASYVLGQQVRPSQKIAIETFLESEEFARNMLLGDLITPKILSPVWLQGDAEPSEEAVRGWLAEHKWNSVLDKFEPWWQTYSDARA